MQPGIRTAAGLAMEKLNPKASSSVSNTQINADAPPWRRDFPIDWPQDEYVSRRDFIKFAAYVGVDRILTMSSFAFLVYGSECSYWLGVSSLIACS